jgi:hypothetical protein
MKTWFTEREILTYVNGIAGQVLVKMQKDSFKVTMQRSKSMPSMVKCP